MKYPLKKLIKTLKREAYFIVMSKKTCVRQRSVRELMREDANSEILFQKYTLSEETVARLESIREMLKDDIAQANPLWKVIAGKVRIVQSVRS